MDPMPSGNRAVGSRRSRAEPRRRGGGDDLVALRHRACALSRIRAMDPMPSGQNAGEATQAAGGVGGTAAQADQIAATITMRQTGGAATRQTLGRARAGAEAAMQAAAAIGHGRLAAAAVRARAGA